MAPNPYYADNTVTLYVGDMREILPALDVTADLVLADPPYGETSLAWDRWPDGWLEVAATVSSSLWCFGSARMFWDHTADFASWKLAQDLIWEKPEGMGVATDRFRRVHEHAWHFYRGSWKDIHHETPRTKHYGARVGRTVTRSASGKSWHGDRGAASWQDDGTRITRTVLRVPNMHKRGIHPTEKPVGILDPLIRYAAPPRRPGGRSVCRVRQHVGRRPPIRSPEHRHRSRRAVRRESSEATLATPAGSRLTSAARHGQPERTRLLVWSRPRHRARMA